MTVSRPPWPPELGPDTPTNRARVIARACWQALNTLGPDGPPLAANLLITAALFGDDVWLSPPPVTAPPGERLTLADVAALGDVAPDTARKWTTRGLSRSGIQRRLTPGPDGLFDPDAVHEFLAFRRRGAP